MSATPEQEAEALSLWEAGDLEGIVAVIVERDEERACHDCREYRARYSVPGLYLSAKESK